MNFTTCTTQVWVMVESLPKIVQRSVARFGTSVNQDADFRVKMFTDRVEQPSMRVDFLLVLMRCNFFKSWQTSIRVLLPHL